jgi:hypothetical protein
MLQNPPGGRAEVGIFSHTMFNNRLSAKISDNLTSMGEKEKLNH